LEKPFKFLPGQFLHLTLDDYDPGSGWPESRCFSIQGQDMSGQIIITFSAKGRYTSRMAKELVQGKILWLKMPYGNLFQNVPDKTNCIFISGGTGITPFLSMFTDESFRQYRNPKLYAGFRNTSFDLYDDFLSIAGTINPEFKYYKIYEDLDGVLNIEKIHKDQNSAAVYFLSGPPKMIMDFKDYFISKSLPDINIRTDEWE
jgi:ferredoxin-NADP reductase